MNMYNAAMEKVLDHLPDRMKSLPITDDGWPQLFFAGITKEGKPDLRCADPAKKLLCVKKGLCWLCGQQTGVHKAFCLGPMCAVTRSTAEPPCHRECAEFAAIACPFLTRPKMKRNEVDMPEGHQLPPGIAIMRNPGVTCIWICKTFKPFKTGQGSEWLIRVGNPTEVIWYAEGRLATREQILESIDSGYHLLHREAMLDGTEAIGQLAMQRKAIESLLPA